MGRWDPRLVPERCPLCLIAARGGPSSHQELAVSHPGLAGTVEVFRGRPCAWQGGGQDEDRQGEGNEGASLVCNGTEDRAGRICGRVLTEGRCLGLVPTLAGSGAAVLAAGTEHRGKCRGGRAHELSFRTNLFILREGEISASTPLECLWLD